MWRLYDYKRNEAIHPLKYETKSQYDLVEEICDELQSCDLIFLHGAVGTGKSVIALHIVANFGKGIIQTPTKALENQYEKDYHKGNFRILLDDGSYLKVGQIKGRNNFDCPYYYNRVKCDHRNLPCTRPLRKGEHRLGVAKECPYWSPVTRKEIAENYAEQLDAAVSEYEAVGGSYGFVHRQENCPYYNQYQAYLKEDIAIIMNSALWDIETFSGRKVRVPVEIIDEGDAYLDSLCLRVSISEERLKTIFKKYGNIIEDDFREDLLKEFNRIVENYAGYTGSVELVAYLLDLLIELHDLTGELNRIKIIGMYEDKAYIGVFENRVMFYLAEPSFILKELRKRSGKIVFMSATFQNISVLEEVYGLAEEYAFCFGETRFPGTVYLRRTGKEEYINHKRWKNEEFRKGYYELRDSIVNMAKQPKLIQVWGKKYAKGVDRNFKNVNVLEDGEEDWSTVASRGIDLADDKCRSIILLKCPFPDAKDPILQTMRKKLGDKAFWKYYNDITERNLIQQVGRGVRHEDDWVEVWSPDKWVFDKLLKVWKGKIVLQ